MAKMDKPTFELVSAADIVGLCPAVIELADTASNLVFASSVTTLSTSALAQLSLQHPVHLIRRADKYQIFCGFRTYQLMVAKDVSCKLHAFVYKNPNSEFIQQMAATELLGARLMHSLGSKPAMQIAKIIGDIGAVEAERIAPGLRSTRAISRSLKPLE
jgi:hypothetical protein